MGWARNRFSVKRRGKFCLARSERVRKLKHAPRKKASRLGRDALETLLVNLAYAFCAARRKNVGTSRSSAAFVFSW